MEDNIVFRSNRWLLPLVPLVQLMLTGSAGAQSSLVVNPQQGATPAPPPVATPSPTPAPPPTVVAPPTTPIPSAPVSLPRSTLPYGPPAGNSGALVWQDRDGLPVPTTDPMAIDPGTDPILRLARNHADTAEFQAAIAAAVARNPSIDEALAQQQEAVANRNEARAAQQPVADLSLSSFKILSRAFSNDPDNVLERSRPDRRTDGTLHIQQPVFDFATSSKRVRAGNARIAAAAAGVEDMGAQLALRAITAWYSVYGYRALVRLGDAFAASQRSLRAGMEERIRQGVAAPGDLAQVDSYIASAETQVADFRRSLAGAEAQYTALVGSAPPADIARAPEPNLAGIAPASATDVAALPIVRAARANAQAASLEARAANADLLPKLSASVDAGRYGVIETTRDYDIRGTLTLALRLGGGGQQRAEQAKARANGADAHARGAELDAVRDAQIAWSDIAALEEAQKSIAANYIASRRSRDVLVERFRVSRGTLLDVVAADGNYFSVAARYIQTLTELDTARYALLARTGRLLPALGIQPASWSPR